MDGKRTEEDPRIIKDNSGLEQEFMLVKDGIEIQGEETEKNDLKHEQEKLLEEEHKRAEEARKQALKKQEAVKNKHLIDSFDHAFEGLLHAFANEKNLRFHLIVAAITLFVSLFMPLTRVELMILFIVITFVIMAEMFNTAVETVVDAFVDYYHPLAKVAKDVAAGAVLLTALNAVAVGYLLFFTRVKKVPLTVWRRLQDAPDHLTFFILIIVVALVVFAKILFVDRNKKVSLQGGMPSLHTALGFSAATAIGLLSENFFVAALSFLLAVLLGQSRIEGQIHSFWEVVMGAVLGILVTILLFQLFR